jgi:uncharacterized protein (TIGR04255 family)
VRFANPPIIEAWIEFRFSYSEEAPYWDETRAEAFISHYFEGKFTVNSYFGRSEIAVDASQGRPDFSKPKLIFERIRAASAAQDRYVQAGRDTLIYNMVRKQQDWPQYGSLRSEALDAYGKYVEFLRPSSLQAVSLHYRDLVVIPLSQNKKVKLDDYFTILPNVPEDVYGDISGFMIALDMPEVCKSGLTRLIIQSEPSPPSPNPSQSGARFRMDWQVNPYNPIQSLDKAIVTKWLDEAHEELFKAFLATFTKKGLRLFQ